MQDKDKYGNIVRTKDPDSDINMSAVSCCALHLGACGMELIEAIRLVCLALAPKLGGQVLG